MDYSNINVMKKKNSTMVKAAFVMGILSVVSAITCFSFLTPVFGGLGILFALLSKGKEDVMEKKAKYGLIMSAVSFIATLILIIASFAFTFYTMSQYEPEELSQYLNEVYEETYGKSFDEMYEDIYGESFSDAYEDAYKQLYGDM